MAAVPASAPGGAAKPLKIVARVHAAPPEHNAGAEHMLISMLRPLVERGHKVEVWLSRYGKAVEPYLYRGVTIVPQAARLDFSLAVRRADVLISHLECVPSTAALAHGHGKPLVVVCHNTHKKSFRDMAAGETALAVYNSEWMGREAEVFYAEYPASLHPRQTLVVRPPVFAEDYRVPSVGDCITLINCNTDKGGELLWRLAKRMPDHKFLGVRGAYGVHVTPPAELPNLEYIKHVPGENMRELVYARTRVLLLPSRYESWGRVGVEALASGIPVIAHPNPGVCEALGDAGLYADHTDLDAYLGILTKLDKKTAWNAASRAAKARSKQLDPAEELAAWCSQIEALA